MLQQVRLRVGRVRRAARVTVTVACERCGRLVPQPLRGFRGRFCSRRCLKAAYAADQRSQRAAKSGLSGVVFPADSVRPGAERRGRTESAVPAPPAPGRAEKVGTESVPPRYHADNSSHLALDQDLYKSRATSVRKKNEADGSSGDDLRQDRRRARFELLDALREWTIFDRVRKCGKIPNGVGGVALRAKDGAAYWSGYCTCGSVWSCPVCAAVILFARADEIGRIAAAHIEAGAEAWLVSLTARHRLYHALAPLFDAVAKGWSRLTQGKAWVGDAKRGLSGERDRLGLVGWVRTLEVTFGFVNGFHPHLHVLLLTDPRKAVGDPAVGLGRAMGRWTKVWQKWMVDLGYEPPSDKRGIDWRKCYTAEEAAGYITKIQEGGGLGNEMARSDMKRGRHKTMAMFEFVEYFTQTGDARFISVWREYEKVTFRRRSITMSQGLRKLYLGDEPEKTDEELAAQDRGGDLIARVDNVTGLKIGSNPRLKAHLLDVFENEGYAGLVHAFAALHLTAEFAPPERALPGEGISCSTESPEDC